MRQGEVSQPADSRNGRNSAGLGLYGQLLTVNC